MDAHAAGDIEEDGESGLDDGSGGTWKKVWNGEDHKSDASEEVEPKRHGRLTWLAEFLCMKGEGLKMI